MPFLIENIISTVVWLIVVGLVIIVAFVATALQRRVTRERFFHELDAARARAQHIIESVAVGALPLAQAIEVGKRFRRPPEQRALEDAIVGRPGQRLTLETRRDLVNGLGWTRVWIDTLRCRAGTPSEILQRALTSLGDTYKPLAGWRRVRLLLRANFLERCSAARRLATVPTGAAILALLAGTEDPHTEVREICIRKLGHLADPATLPVLIEDLVEVLEGRSSLSVRTLKSALVRYPLDEMDEFRDALVHSNRRVRFFATDIIREVAARHAGREQLGKNDFSPELYRLFTEHLCVDENDDVRARAASVIAHFYDTTSTQLLGILLEDSTWFVRLHACRAVASSFYMSLIPNLARRLTDPHWMVREAAARSLTAMGDAGLDAVFRAFLTTTDAYSAEQIAEELQREGILLAQLANLSEVSADEDYWRTRNVLRRMVQLGKNSLLQGYLVAPGPPRLKLMLMEELSGSISASYIAALQACAANDTDPQVRMTATSIIQAVASGSVQAASGAHQAASGSHQDSERTISGPHRTGSGPQRSGRT